MRYTITVYINPYCGPCNTLKKWLKENQLNFVEKDILNDSSAAQEFKEQNQKFTPYTVIETDSEKHQIIGANTKKIEKILLSTDKDS